MIKKSDIQEILKGLARSSTEPYLSEAQFQFDLAWALQNKACCYNIKKILLECTALMHYNKRFEYDIIVLFEDNTFIAIELKYKTSKANINGVHLVQQAGQPGTKYDYLWDVHRIELLKTYYTGLSIINNEYHRNSKILNAATCLGGYAIFLTNDSSYYNGNEKNNESAFNFRLQSGRHIAQKTDLNWVYRASDIPTWMASRKTFQFIDDHTLDNWENFSSYSENKYFKYLITEI